MEIDITRFFAEAAPADFSASRAERGENAGQETWQAALKEAEDAPLLSTPEELDAMRNWARSTGAWEEEEIAAWSNTEINALFIQLVSGDMREADLHPGMTKAEWKRYERDAQAGRVSGCIFGGPLCVAEHHNKVFYLLEG